MHHALRNKMMSKNIFKTFNAVINGLLYCVPLPHHPPSPIKHKGVNKGRKEGNVLFNDAFNKGNSSLTFYILRYSLYSWSKLKKTFFLNFLFQQINSW